MYIGSGVQNLNQQNQTLDQKSRKDSSDSKGFDDFMGMAKKKEPVREPRASNSNGTRKKDYSKASGDGENHQAVRIEDRPHKRNTENTQGRRDDQVKGLKNEAPSNKETRLSSKIVNNSQKVSGQKVEGQTKNLENHGKQDSVPLSTISSETSEGTLVENQNKINKMEKAFSDIMSQSKKQNALKAQNGVLGQNMAGTNKASQNFLKPQGQNGKMKIDSEMTLNDKLETLEGMGTQDDPLNSVVKSQDSDSQMDQELSSFEQLLSNEGEVKTQGDTPKTSFADEITLAQGEGKAQKIENLQSVIKQARAVVDDGGGSMEIHLQPEGLGKVHLKVAVNDGQVNVEMMTDNQLAKKALEEGILDIKQALEGQKLLVETLKVEMSPDYQKDFSDLENHMQEQANRDFAEQFLGQFQRERDERLGGMFDAFRNFRPDVNEPDLNLGRNPYTENGKGRSVNLVA